jgi:thioesterase domain-containing protein/aryl carrier-like protein
MTEENLRHAIKQLSESERKLLTLKIKDYVINGSPTFHSKSQKKIIAYVKTNDFLDRDGLKGYLKNQLPDYMIPSSIHEIDEVPLLPNGKIDKNELLKTKKISSNGTSGNPSIVKPKTDIEEKLVEIWQNILGFSPISTHDNFFEIGGDSILSIQIISKARTQGIDIKPNQLFENQTINELAKNLSKKLNENEDYKLKNVTTIRKGGTKIPLFCIHSGGGHVFFYGLLKNYIKPNRPIYAIQPIGLSQKIEMHKNVEEMAVQYLKVIREIQPKGPYNILVNCFSTSVGNEISILLEKLGEEINLIVVDTMASSWNATDNESLKARIKFFSKRFLSSPIETINLFFQERAYLIEPLRVKFFGKDYEKELEKLKANLRKMSLKYVWKSHSGKVSLILTHKEDKKFEGFTINSWKKLALGGVKVVYTSGHHNRLFEEPDIQSVSEKIDECIIE